MSKEDGDFSNNSPAMQQGEVANSNIVTTSQMLIPDQARYVEDSAKPSPTGHKK